MDRSALRALALRVNLSAHGVAVTVTVEGAAPIQTTGIWAPSLIEEMPVGRDRSRKDPRRILALPVADVGDVPRGASIEATEYGGETRTWRVDGVESQTPEQIHVVVIPVASA